MIDKLKCFYCHKPVPRDSNFCNHCGNKLSVIPVISNDEQKSQWKVLADDCFLGIYEGSIESITQAISQLYAPDCILFIPNITKCKNSSLSLTAEITVSLKNTDSQPRMIDFAYHVLALACENHLAITNLDLNIVMFFALRYAINESLFDESLLINMYDDPFIVSNYGPQLTHIYKKFSVYGASPILDDSKICKVLNRPVFNNKIVDLLNEDVFSLVAKTKMENFWKTNKSNIKNKINYSFTDVKG